MIPLRRLVSLLLGCVGIALAEESVTPYDTERSASRPMTPAEAAAGWKLPPGFRMDLVAAEPDVRQPIAMSFDPRGRLWVAENHTFAEVGVFFATNLSDRVLILEDADRDGKFEGRKVFLEGLKLLTSVETGWGGVWLMCPPRLLFVPDRDGNGVPDGPAEVMLDGFDTTTGSHHTFANGLKWGPDGWLWGRVGISSPTRVGVPGTPEPERIAMGGGIWRFHPGTRRVEAVSHGTTNPWGLDWNAEGEPFFINTVIGHLWHAIPGAHFRRMYGDDPTPYVYTPIEQHADHFHFDTGAGWTKSRAGQQDGSVDANSDSLGGGHAHTGLLIQQGGNWPAEYEGALLTLNFHGRRINRERLERSGSGYVGRHMPDFGQSPDPWFRPIDLVPAPDGSVLVADWSDTGECHDNDGVHRNSGRIYRLSYTNAPSRDDAFRGSPPLDELLAAQSGPSEWRRRQGRKLLRESLLRYGPQTNAQEQLLERLASEPDRLGRLRALWGLVAVDGTTPELLRRLLRDGDEHVRSWAVRLLSDEHPAPSAPTVDDWTRLARTEPSPLVRLYLTGALRRMPAEQRLPMVLALSDRAQDDTDPNLGRLLWFQAEPLVSRSPSNAVVLAGQSRIRLLRQNIARRLGEDPERHSEALGTLLRQNLERRPDDLLDLLDGLSTAVRGRARAAAPAGWTEIADRLASSAHPRVVERARELGSVFGDGRAMDALFAVARDPAADVAARRSAVKALVTARPAGLAELLRGLMSERELWAVSLTALIRIGDPAAPELIAGKIRWMPPTERSVVIAEAGSRAATALAVLDAVADRRIPVSAVEPAVARQMSRLADPAVSRRLAEAWGTVGAPDADGRKSIERLRAELADTTGADLPSGRAVFQRLCASCHRLYGEGGQVGPDLTGSGRSQLEYLLENVVTPNAVVAADFRMTVVETRDGRTLGGLLREPGPKTVTLLQAGEAVVVERSEISRMETTPNSMMPEGLLEGLTPQERRDLVGYLRHPNQVPLPKP